jgi:EpsI family protein
MFSNKMSLIIAVLMIAASIGAVVAKPAKKVADEVPISLEKMVPKSFGDWRELPDRNVGVVNPQTQQLLDKLYSQILTRTYVNSKGYAIMLSLAYGSDQRGELGAHKPEVCYPAQGFTLKKNDAGVLGTPFGEIPVRRLNGHMGPRVEPVTYWFTVGDKAVKSTTEKRIVDLRFALTGRIPDGMLFRISSIDENEARAYQLQDDFVQRLLEAVPVADRKRLSGLDTQLTAK